MGAIEMDSKGFASPTTPSEPAESRGISTLNILFAPRSSVPSVVDDFLDRLHEVRRLA